MNKRDLSRGDDRQGGLRRDSVSGRWTSDENEF